MADSYLGALKQIERRAQNNILIFSDVLSERLDTIAESMVGNSMSDNDYLKLLEMYYKRFSKDENKDAMLFCLLRMQEIAVLKEHPKAQMRFKHIEFQQNYDPITFAFLDRKRPYYQNMMEKSLKRILFWTTLLYILLLCVCVLCLHISFWIGFIICLLVWIGSNIYGYLFGAYRLYTYQMKTLSKNVDPILLDVDHSILNL